MSLPILISVPHAGLVVPDEVRDLCQLTEAEIIADGDEGAAGVYDLETEVDAYVITDVARAIVDLNRAEDDFRKDGVIKTHTCLDVEVYRKFPSAEIIETLLEKYHRPYHRRLTDTAREVRLGVDGHTMLAVGPPVGPDPGRPRPHLCLSDGGSAFPEKWLHSLARRLERSFETRVSINDPFKGGHIIRSHAIEMPWIQLELSRAPFLSLAQKRERVLDALKTWCAHDLD